MFFKICQEKLLWITLLFLLLIPIFLSTYKLSESPPVWYDEGIFTQVAINLSRGYGHRLQVAPQEFVSAQAATTSFVVTYPISLVFKYFGITIVHARAVMVFFLLLAVMMSFLFIWRMGGFKSAFYGTLLLVSFAPLYGHGKSVLGEVPGISFFFLFLYLLNRLEQSRFPSKILYASAGLMASFSVITKPFFLILVPIFLVVGILFRRITLRTAGGLLSFIVAFVIPFLIWLMVQFSGSPLMDIYTHYANPNSVNIWQAVFKNARLFFTELQPAYFLILLGVWIVSFFLRIRRLIYPTMTECVAAGFSFVTFLVFFRTSGFYRYFFPGQLVALLFLPFLLFNFARLFQDRFTKISWLLPLTIHAILLSIIAFQFYQTSFHSWVAKYYSSANSAQLEDYFKNFDIKKSIFLYNVPEVAIFLPADTAYFQYLKISKDIIISKEQLQQIARGFPDQIIMTNLFWSEHQDQFENYGVTSTVLTRYKILERIKKDRF